MGGRSKSGPVIVIRPDGSREERPAASFRRERIDEHGCCGRCGSPVYLKTRFYNYRGQKRKRRYLVDAYGLKGQEHVCLVEIRARSTKSNSAPSGSASTG